MAPNTPREADLEAQLKQRDAQLAELTLQVSRLTEQLAAGAGLHLPVPRTDAPFSGMRPSGMGRARKTTGRNTIDMWIDVCAPRRVCSMLDHRAE